MNVFKRVYARICVDKTSVDKVTEKRSINSRIWVFNYSRTSVRRTSWKVSHCLRYKELFRILVCILDFDWFRNQIAFLRELNEPMARYSEVQLYPML